MKPVPLEVTMMKRIGELNAENARLQAEVERLTKAGDSLVLSVEWRNVVIHDPTLTFIAVKPDCLCNCHNFDSDIKLWLAAKEGKGQP